MSKKNLPVGFAPKVTRMILVFYNSMSMQFRRSIREKSDWLLVSLTEVEYETYRLSKTSIEKIHTIKCYPMELILESSNLNDYLKEVPPVIQFNTPLIQKQIKIISSQTDSLRARAKLAFEFARDEIQHSFDSETCQLVTINAEETIGKGEGICFAKAHVLASLLRGMSIPSGFCYQRKNNPKAGYVMHGLNAIYLEETGWFRVDPRGNKPGIDAQFSTDVEQLAYPIDTIKGEVDYPNVFTEPLPEVITAMKHSENVQELFYNRPETLM